MNKTKLITLGLSLCLAFVGIVSLLTVEPAQTHRAAAPDVDGVTMPSNSLSRAETTEHSVDRADSGEAQGATEQAVANPVSAHRFWRPGRLALEDWGEFFIEFVDFDSAEDDQIRVVGGDPGPHLSMRVRPSRSTRFAEHMIDELLDRLTIATPSLQGLHLERVGRLGTTTVRERSENDERVVTVHVIHFAFAGVVPGKSYWGDVVAKPKGMDEIRPGFSSIPKRVSIVHTIHSPSIEPRPANNEDSFDDLNDLGYAGIFAILEQLPGFHEVDIQIRIDDKLVPTEVIETSLTSLKRGVGAIGFPTNERLGRVRMYVGLRVRTGWWKDRKRLHVVLRVRDASDSWHVLPWTPDLD